MQSLELRNPPEKGAEGPLLAIHRSASGRPLVGLLSHHGDINDASKAAIGLVLDAARLYHLCACPTTNVQQQHGISVRRQHVNGMLALIDTDGVRGVHGSRFC